MIIITGYTKIDDGSGTAVSHTTGEIVKTKWIEVPENSLIYTPDQLEIIKRKNEKAQKSYWQRKSNKPLGRFYFILADEQFKDLSPETVTRLIYLNTFLAFGDNRLMNTQRKQIKKSDLPKILEVSESTAKRFWAEVKNKYLNEDKYGLYANNSIFRSGKLKDKQYNTYQKFYITAIRTLYRATKKHKHLGYIFKMLPFINFEHNILCKNPEETTLDEIQCLTLAEFCEAIKFDRTHLNRLLQIYNKLTFNVRGHEERFCAIVYDGLHKDNAKIIINPHILYCGSNYQQVKNLAIFCKD